MKLFPTILFRSTAAPGYGVNDLDDSRDNSPDYSGTFTGGTWMFRLADYWQFCMQFFREISSPRKRRVAPIGG